MTTTRGSVLYLMLYVECGLSAHGCIYTIHLLWEEKRTNVDQKRYGGP